MNRTRYNPYMDANGLTDKQIESFKKFREIDNPWPAECSYRATLYLFSPLTKYWESRVIFTLDYNESLDWCNYMMSIYEKQDFPAFYEIIQVG